MFLERLREMRLTWLLGTCLVLMKGAKLPCVLHLLNMSHTIGFPGRLQWLDTNINNQLSSLHISPPLLEFYILIFHATGIHFTQQKYGTS